MVGDFFPRTHIHHIDHYLERQFMREKLSDTLTERIFQITEIM